MSSSGVCPQLGTIASALSPSNLRIETAIIRTAMSIRVGQRAPNFRLAALRGGEVSLSDFAGKKNVVLFFYPKDDTSGCTAEACTFRDAYEDFVAAGAEVIGISSDSVESHQQFSSKHQLPMQ